MARNALRVILGLLSLLILLVMLAVIEHYRGVGRLGQWRRAALARGEKLTIAELAPPRPAGQATVPPDDVVAVLFSSGDTGKFWKASEALKIRLKVNKVGPGRIPVAWKEAWEWKDLAESTNTWVELAAKVEELRPFFQVIRSNLAERKWIIGSDYTQGYKSRVVDVLQLINLTQVFAAATVVDLHQHRLDDAREDLMTLPRLAGVLSEQQWTIAEVGRFASVNRAVPAAWQALQAPGWTEPQLAQLQAAWESQSFLTNTIRALQVERAVADEAGFGPWRCGLMKSVELVKQQGVDSESVGWAIWRYAWLDQDQFFCDHTLQESIDFARAALSAKSCRAAWLQRKPTPGPLTAPDLRAPPVWPNANTSSRYGQMRYKLSRVLLPNPADLINWAVTLENVRGLFLSAVALKRYELGHGRSAPSLAALVPEYLDTVPVDFMDGQPLRYRLQEDGTWRLYSIGWDGKDDGGDPTPASPGQKYETFSDGRDWVWPVPATPPDRGKAR